MAVFKSAVCSDNMVKNTAVLHSSAMNNNILNLQMTMHGLLPLTS